MIIHGLLPSIVPNGFTIRGDDGDYKSINGSWVRIRKVKSKFEKEGDKYIQHIIYSNPKIEQDKIEYEYHSDTEELQENKIQIQKANRGRPRNEKRNTRVPTKYNLFIKEHMNHVKQLYPNNNNQENLKVCILYWKEKLAS